MSEKQQYEVKLEHKSNPDIRGGYWTPPATKGKAQWVPINAVEDASAVCLTYIKQNELGVGNWTGGQVRRSGTAQIIAYVSYNGRTWKASNKAPFGIQPLEAYDGRPSAPLPVFAAPVAQWLEGEDARKFFVDKTRQGVVFRFGDAVVTVGESGTLHLERRTYSDFKCRIAATGDEVLVSLTKTRDVVLIPYVKTFVRP